ncbi:hypothetical protein HKD37_07G019562 [Glycine soja]
MTMKMTTPTRSPPPSLHPPTTDAASHSSPTLKQTRKATRLRSLATRPVRVERPLVHVDPTTGKADGPHSKKLRTYLKIVARDKVDVTYKNWKQVPAAQKDLIWEDIQTEFDIPKASDLRTKNQILQTIGERWRRFNFGLTSKRALAADNDSSRRDPSWEDVQKKTQAIQKQNIASHVLSRGGYEFLENKLMEEKKKKQLEEAAKSGSTDTVIDPPSPIRQHVKWKMAHTKKTGQMTFEAAKEIADKIDVLTTAIGRPEHPGHVRTTGAGVTIKQYFGPAPRTSRTYSSMVPEDLEQLTQKIGDQLEESITEKELALPPELEVGPSAARVNTKKSYVDPSGNDPDTGDSEKCGLKSPPPRLVAIGRLYKGSTTVHNIPLRHDQVKVGVEEVRDANAHVLIPTEEVQLEGQALNTFVAWPTHLVKRLSEQRVVGLAKPADRPDHDVIWDATVFGVFNDNFPLYIKHEDLSEIAHGGQCLNISIIQLWILHMTETRMRAGNVDVYGFLEPQSIQRSGQSQFESESYIKNWIPDNYLKVIINRLDLFFNTIALALVVNIIILVVQYASMFVLNSALKGLDDTPQSKSKVATRQKGSIEYGYYVMYCMSTIILGSFKNNWEIYFNDAKSLEPERLKKFRIQRATYYLKVKNETISV